MATATVASPWRLGLGDAGPNTLEAGETLDVADAPFVGGSPGDEDALLLFEPPPELCFSRAASPPLDAAGSPPLVPIPATVAHAREPAAPTPSPRLRDQRELGPPDPFVPTCPPGSPSGGGGPLAVRIADLSVHLAAESQNFAWMRQHLGGPHADLWGWPPAGAFGTVTFEVADEAAVQEEVEVLLRGVGDGAFLPPPTAPRPRAPRAFCTTELAESLTDALLDSVHDHFTARYYAYDAKGRARARDCGPLAWELGHTSVAARAERARLERVRGGPLLELLDHRAAEASPRGLGGPAKAGDALRLEPCGWRGAVAELLRPGTLEALHAGLFAKGLVQVLRNGSPVTLGHAPRRRHVALVSDAEPASLQLRLGWTHEGLQAWQPQGPGNGTVWVDGTLFVGLGLTLRRADPPKLGAVDVAAAELWLASQAARGPRNAAKGAPGPLPSVARGGRLAPG